MLPAEFGTEEICLLLCRIGMVQYAPEVMRVGMDGRMLTSMRRVELEDFFSMRSKHALQLMREMGMHEPPEVLHSLAFGDLSTNVGCCSKLVDNFEWV